MFSFIFKLESFNLIDVMLKDLSFIDYLERNLVYKPMHGCGYIYNRMSLDSCNKFNVRQTLFNHLCGRSTGLLQQ